jgi:hypothetical protein
MECREKPQTDKYWKIMNDWEHGSSGTMTPLPVSELEKF